MPEAKRVNCPNPDCGTSIRVTGSDKDEYRAEDTVLVFCPLCNKWVQAPLGDNPAPVGLEGGQAPPPPLKPLESPDKGHVPEWGDKWPKSSE